MTWRAKKSDATNGGYSQSVLETLFSHYGSLHHVLVSSKKKGKALVSFHSGLDAVSKLADVPVELYSLLFCLASSSREREGHASLPSDSQLGVWTTE